MESPLLSLLDWLRTGLSVLVALAWLVGAAWAFLGSAPSTRRLLIAGGMAGFGLLQLLSVGLYAALNALADVLGQASLLYSLTSTLVTAGEFLCLLALFGAFFLPPSPAVRA